MMEKHKIVLVPFPFDNFSELKVRPAVCLTNSIGPHKHVVIAFITSKAPEELEKTDIVLDQSHASFMQTGLKVSSTIRLHRLVTIGSLFIQRELGRLPEDVKSLVDQKMKQLFDLE